MYPPEFYIACLFLIYIHRHYSTVFGNHKGFSGIFAPGSKKFFALLHIGGGFAAWQEKTARLRGSHTVFLRL